MYGRVRPSAPLWQRFPMNDLRGALRPSLPSADAASRTITVRAELPNPRGRLKPGMFAQVSLSPDTRRALLVPSEAVIRTGRRNLVMLKQDEGAFLPAEVEIGREANGRTEILAGLAEGEQVVTSGQFLIDSEASLAGIDVRSIDGSMKHGVRRPSKDENLHCHGKHNKDCRSFDHSQSRAGSRPRMAEHGHALSPWPTPLWSRVSKRGTMSSSRSRSTTPVRASSPFGRSNDDCADY